MSRTFDKILERLGIDLTYKKRLIALLVILLFLVGTFLLFELDKRTTFDKMVSHNLNEESIVRNISIRIMDPSGERIAHVTLTDKKIIDSILSDFSGMKLRKDEDAPHFFREYYISIITTNERDGILYTEGIRFSLDEDYLDDYEIRSKSDHLKTIRELIDREDVEWIRDA